MKKWETCSQQYVAFFDVMFVPFIFKKNGCREVSLNFMDCIFICDVSKQFIQKKLCSINFGVDRHLRILSHNSICIWNGILYAHCRLPFTACVCEKVCMFEREREHVHAFKERKRKKIGIICLDELSNNWPPVCTVLIAVIQNPNEMICFSAQGWFCSISENSVKRTELEGYCHHLSFSPKVSCVFSLQLDFIVFSIIYIMWKFYVCSCIDLPPSNKVKWSCTLHVLKIYTSASQL